MNNFGVMALHKVDINTLKKTCDKWEENGWLSNYVILKGNDEWNAISDENLEWGNIDVYIHQMFHQVNATIFSVEYYDFQVRYRIWQTGKCIGEKSIGYDAPSVQNTRTINTIFATKLQVNNNLITKIFAIQEAEQSVLLMETLLQCQFWKREETTSGCKIVTAKYGSRKDFEKYLRQYDKGKTMLPAAECDKVLVNKSITVNGMLLGSRLSSLVIFSEENGEGIFSSVNQKGERHEELRISLDMLPHYFWTKHYIGDRLIGLLTRENGFVLYENGKKLSEFPDIKRTTMPPWYAYMLNEDLIFMEWACYDAKSGEKKWDFPFPIDNKSYKNFLQPEMWHELPNGLFITQINVDQEMIYISLMDSYGNIKAFISREISYGYYRVDVDDRYVYIIKDAKNIAALVEVTLFDFELNEIGIYRLEANLIDYGVLFDSNSCNFYVLAKDKIVQINIDNRTQRDYPIPLGKKTITTWGKASEDIFYLILNERELLLLDSQQNMKCVLKHKIKGYYLDYFLLDTGNSMIISQDSNMEGQITLQEICFTETGVGDKAGSGVKGKSETKPEVKFSENDPTKAPGDDWRLTNQDKYLKGQELIRKKYQDRCTKTDHDHCEFCLEKFGEGQYDLHQGYGTKDDYYWICDICYEDFKTQFNWIVKNKI